VEPASPITPAFSPAAERNTPKTRRSLRRATFAIVGAPFDNLVSDRPGTRFGPRAIRAASLGVGPHLEAKVDPLTELRVIDLGDAPVVPADSARSHAAIEDVVAHVLGAGALPVVLAGDYSITEPDVRACATVRGPVGLVHFDTHADTAREVFGAELSQGTPMYRLVTARAVASERYVQIGLRGYWPGEEEFAWRERGVECSWRAVVGKSLASSAGRSREMG
jgi:arginase family enzyme